MIVIPMAGTSERFMSRGYSVPKYMLPLDGRPLFDWTVLSFQALFDQEKFLFIARDISDTKNFLIERLHFLGIKNTETVFLDSPTAGQAETVELGLIKSASSDDETLVIFNIDTLRPGFMEPHMPGTDGWLDVFRAPGDNWSFVEPQLNDKRSVRRTKEKERISDLCCTGLYVFRRADLFSEALAMERANPSSKELYVAPLYNHLIRSGYHIAWREASIDSVIVSGTPDEYEALAGQNIAHRFDL